MSGAKEVLYTDFENYMNNTFIRIKIKITGLPSGEDFRTKWDTYIKPILKQSNYNVDLSETIIPLRSDVSGLCKDCKGLVVAPSFEIPIYSSQKTIGNANEAFCNCTKLELPPPVIPYFTSYVSMFENCTSLQTDPLIVTSGKECPCARMFYGCTSLKYVENPLPEGITDCKCMFQTSGLKQPPKLPSTVTDGTLTFADCVDMYSSAPSLPHGIMSTAYMYKNTLVQFMDGEIPDSVTNATEMFAGDGELKALPPLPRQLQAITDIIKGCQKCETLLGFSAENVSTRISSVDMPIRKIYVPKDDVSYVISTFKLANPSYGWGAEAIKVFTKSCTKKRWVKPTNQITPEYSLSVNLVGWSGDQATISIIVLSKNTHTKYHRCPYRLLIENQEVQEGLVTLSIQKGETALYRIALTDWNSHFIDTAYFRLENPTPVNW